MNGVRRPLPKTLLGRKDSPNARHTHIFFNEPILHNNDSGGSTRTFKNNTLNTSLTRRKFSIKENATEDANLLANLGSSIGICTSRASGSAAIHFDYSNRILQSGLGYRIVGIN